MKKNEISKLHNCSMCEYNSSRNIWFRDIQDIREGWPESTTTCKIIQFLPGPSIRCLITNFLSPMLSGEDIWNNLLTQKRYTVHTDGCDIWNDLRPFLNFLVHPFSSKLRSKEAKGLKSGNLGKRNFFLNINFLLHSLLFLCSIVKFHL